MDEGPAAKRGRPVRERDAEGCHGRGGGGGAMGAAAGLRAGTVRNGARSNPPKGSAPSRHPSRSGTLATPPGTGRPMGGDKLSCNEPSRIPA